MTAASGSFPFLKRNLEFNLVRPQNDLMGAGA